MTAGPTGGLLPLLARAAIRVGQRAARSLPEGDLPSSGERIVGPRSPTRAIVLMGRARLLGNHGLPRLCGSGGAVSFPKQGALDNLRCAREFPDWWLQLPAAKAAAPSLNDMEPSFVRAVWPITSWEPCEAEGQHVSDIMAGHASARFGFGLDNSFATLFGHLWPAPQSGSVIRRLGDANGALVSSTIGPRSNLSILIYCIPADIQPSHCGLLCIDEVRKERGHGIPSGTSNSVK